MLCKLSRILSCLLPGLAIACGVAPTATTSPVIYDACAPLAVVTDPDITPDERRGVVAGLALWNTLANTRLRMTIATANLTIATANMTIATANLTIATASADATDAPSTELPLHFQQAAAAFHGYYDDQAGLVFINRQLANEHQRAVTVAHEIGHAFGLVHVDSRPSLMNSGNLVTEPTQGDADELAARWGRCGLP